MGRDRLETACTDNVHFQVLLKGKQIDRVAASKVKVLVAQLCLTLCDPMDHSLSSSSVHGILQARIVNWVVIPFSRRSSRQRDQIQFSHLADRFFTI